MSNKTIRIGTRASQLALWQANHVRDLLLQAHPDLAVRLIKISTEGDRTLNQPLRQIGGKGLFLKDIEAALGRGEIDLAVHSLKDVPYQLPPGLKLGAFLKRAEVHDVLILAAASEPEDGMVIGTGSLRRQAQLRRLYPELTFADIRGNIDTRLKKMEAGDYDGLVLAAAGLVRMGWADRATLNLSPEKVIPAPGQGTITIEINSDDAETERLIAPLHHEETGDHASAERAFTRAVGGDCSLPVAAWCRNEGDQIKLAACIADLDQNTILRGHRFGSAVEAVALGEGLALEILQHGGAAIVAQYKHR